MNKHFFKNSTATSIWAGGSVLGQLLEWLRWHFVGGDHLAKKAIEHDPPQEHESYWDAVSLPLEIHVITLVWFTSHYRKPVIFILLLFSTYTSLSV